MGKKNYLINVPENFKISKIFSCQMEINEKYMQ